MPIKSGFYKGRLGIGLDTTDNAYTSGSDTGIPLYPVDINGDIRITGCIVDKNGNAINLAATNTLAAILTTDTNNSKIDSSANFNILSTGHLKLPSGTTAQRAATGVLGMLRYNTTTNSFEGYGAGNAWGSLGGVMDIDQDTYITAEQSSDEDKLRFYVGGNEKMLIQNTTNDGIIIKSHIIPDTNAAYDLGNAEKKIRHLFLSDNSLWIGDEHRISIDNDGGMKFKKRNKNVVPKGLRDALSLDSAASITKVKADMGVADISTMKLEDWVNYARTHATGMANADIKDIFNNEDNEDYEQVDGTITTVGELNSITNVNTDTKAQGQPLVWNGGTWSASSDIYIYNGNVGIGTTTPDKYFYNASGTGGTFTGFDTILAIYGGTSGQTNGSANLLFQCDDNHTASIYAEHTGSGNTYMGFSTTTGTAQPAERMRIDKDGNVGIGTTDPYCLLQVGNLGAGGNVYSETKHNRIAFPSHSHSNNRYLFANRDPDNDTSCLDLHYVHNTSSLNKDLMTFNSDGNIGIGTTTPNCKLDVNGDAAIRGQFDIAKTGGTKISHFNWGANGDIYLRSSETAGKIILQDDGGNVGIGMTAPTEKLDVTGNIKASGNVTAHTVTAQNYAVGSVNFISASRQGNFRDLEVKNSSNAATILLTGDGGDISIDGTLSADTIGEKTSGTGVTIDSVLLKDQNVTAHTVTAQNYAVGSVNFISASRQGNFRDLEVKNSSNAATILLTGDGGDISIDGTLSADTISEKTSAAGVTIDSVLLKDNTVTATKFIGDGSELTGVATSGGGGFNWTAQDGNKNISDTNMHHGYKVSASNNSGADANQYSVDNAFRSSSPNPNWEDVWKTTTTSYNTTTGAYTGSETTAGVTGEWLQIDFGRKAKVYHYGILPMGEQGYQTWTAPRTFVLFGSNDGSTWANLGSSSATFAEYHGDYQNQNYDDGNHPKASCKMKETTLSTPATYQYFRLVITANFGNHTQYSEFSDGASDGKIRIGYLAFYGAFPEQVDKVAVVSGTNIVHKSDDVYKNPSITGHTILHYEWQEMRMVITPSASDSIIELKYNLFGDMHNDLCFRITRNISGTDVLVVPASAYNEGVLGIGLHDGPNNSSTPCQHPISWYDEPNTTSTVTYKLWLGASIGGSGFTAHLNRAGSSLGNFIEAGVSTAAAIEHPKPQQSLTTITNASQVEGQVLETLAGVCDGRSVTVSSGTYTLPNISSVFEMSDGSTYQDIPGSFAYKPPQGTKQVIYKFKVYCSGVDTHPILHFNLYIDDTKIDKFNRSWASQGPGENVAMLDFTFEIGNVNDIANGKILTWDTLKTIKIKAREYSASGHEAYIFGTQYYEGSSPPSGKIFVCPSLEITAIGTAQYDVVQRVVNYKDGQLLETLAGKADGSSITVSSGTYTMPTALADGTLLSATYMKETASELTYKAPVGTERILFKFIGVYYYGDADATLEGEFYVDDVKYPGSGSRGHFKLRQGRSPNGEIPFPQVIITSSQYDLSVAHKYYWKVKSYSTGHELYTGYVSATHAGLYPTAGEQFLKIQAIGRAIAPVGNFKIQDVDTITTPPNDGQALVWDDTNKHWKAGAGGGGGGGGGIQTLSSQPTLANSTAGALYYDTSWKSFFGRMESKWMEMMLEGTPLIFGHPSKIIPKSGAAIVETTATTIEFTWVNPPQYRSCMSAKDTGDYVDAINATNHTSGELYLPTINDIWFQYASNTYKVGGKNIPAAVSGNKLQSLSNISGPKKLTNKVVIITTGSSVPSYASSWTPSTSANGDHYIGLDDNGNQTFIFNPNNTTWSLTAATNYNFKVWLENSTPDSLPPSVSHDSTSTADGTSNLVDTRNYSNHDGISTLEILPPTQIYVADNKLTNGFHVTLTRNGNTHYLTCIVPPEALTGTYNGTDDVKVTTTGDINAMDPVVYYKGFEVQYKTAVASDNFDKATSAIVWTGNWTNVVFSSSSTTNQTGTTFSTDADATNRIASFTPLKPTTIIVASGAGTTPTKNDFTVKKSFTLVQNDNKFYKFRVRAFNQVQINISDSVWSEKEYVIRFNKPETVTWKGTAAPHLPLFTTKTAQKLHWYIALNWNQQNIKSSVATGNDGTIDEYAHSDLKIHEYKLQRSQDGDTTWETVAYWTLPDDNAQLETYDYRIQPPHDDRGETETSNDGNNTKTQEARILAGTRAPQYTFKLQARNWLFGTGIDTGSVPGPRTNYQWARASVTDNRWSAESVSSKTTYSTALIPVAPPKAVIHDNADDKYAIKFYEMNTTDTKSPWKDGRIASHTDFNAIVDSSLVTARTKEATLQNETPDQDYISYQWKLPYPSEALKDTLGSSVDRYEIVLETSSGGGGGFTSQSIYGNSEERFGTRVRINVDGTIMAVGMIGYSTTGGVKIYEYTNNTWSQKGNVITADWTNFTYNAATGDEFMLSDDGLTIILNNQNIDNMNGSTEIRRNGAVKVFEWNGSAWVQKGSALLGFEEGDAAHGAQSNWYAFGQGATISGDGSIIAVGDDHYDDYAGRIKIYQYVNNDWSLIHSIIGTISAGDTPGETGNSSYGSRVGTQTPSMSYDGSVIAVMDTSTPPNSLKGRIHVYERQSGSNTYSQKGSTIWEGNAHDRVGYMDNFILNNNGTIIIIGAHNAPTSLARVFEWNGSVWAQKGSDITFSSNFTSMGASVDITNDGSKVIVNAYSAHNSRGETRIYEYVNNDWSQVHSVMGEIGPGNSTNSNAYLKNSAISGNGNRYVSGGNSWRGDANNTADRHGYIVWGTIPTTTLTAYHTQEIYANDFNYGAANWYLQEYTTNTLLDQPLNYKVKGYNFFVTNPSDYSDPLGTALTSDKPSAPQFLSTAADANKDNSNPTFTLTNDGLTLLVDEPQYTSVDANGNANNFQLESLTIQEFQIQPNIDNSDADKTLVQDHANTKRMLSGSNPLLSQGKDVVASFFHPVTGTTALDEMTSGVVKYKVQAKNVLNSTFSDEAEATLTIGKPNPGTNFKFSPKFTWVQATNKIKLEFFRKYSTTDILFDGSSSTNAPISAVTANCNVTNEIKKLKWNVKCSGATGGTITTSYADVGDTTGYIDSGDNSTSTAAYTISDTGVEHWAIDSDHHVRYRVKNQYHSGWFEDPIGSLYSQIKLTAPNAIPSSDISSQISFGLGNTPNKLKILWSKPTQYGLHYKHQGSGSLVAQSNQPNIKTYKVYFNDGTDYYVFTRTATNQADVSDDATLISGTTTVEKWTNSSRNAGHVASHTIRVVAGKTYVIEKITAINWLYDTESGFNTPPTTTYLNGDGSAPPPQPKVEVESAISAGTTTVALTGASDLGFEVGQTVEFDNGTNQEQKTISGIASITLNSALSYSYPLGSTIEVVPSSYGGQILSTTAPIPSPFSNYANQGILIASGSTARTVKKMGGYYPPGTALTDVLLNAAASADTTSTMGIKISVSGDVTGNSSECKFNSDGTVSGNSLILNYSGINMATISVGTYSDLYNGATSSTDNLGYWFINSSIKLWWHADSGNISAFYGKNLSFSVVVTYYGSSNIVLTRQIETGYYDKTIANPSVTTITPAYTPYTCCGLPILHSTDTLTVATVFNNQSSTWVASSAVNTITLGGSVASVTTSKSNHTYSTSTVSLAATDMGSYSGASLVKNAQITVVAKNCNGTASSTNSSKYIYDPKTLDLITTIANDGAIGKIHGTVSTKSGTFTISNMICCQVPTNFNPNVSGQYCHATTGVWTAGKLDVTHADSKIITTGVNRLIMFDGKFCSDAYFRSASGFGTVSTNYDAGVASFLSKADESEGTYTSYFNSGNADLAAMEDNYRWQIFCYGWKYTGTASGFVQAVSFKLGTGTDHNIVYTDFYNASDASKPSDGGPPGSNVEIWTKVAGMGYEGRWNNATAANVTYQGDSGGNLSDLGKNSTNAWCSAVTKGWLTSDGKNTLSGGAATTDEINIAASKASYSASGSDLFYIYVAIGLKNDVSRYITIPTTNNKLYNTGYTNTPG